MRLITFIRGLLCYLLGCSRPRSQLYFIAGTIKISGDKLMARMNNEQTITIGIEPKTASGNPAQIDGNANFAVEPAEAGSFAYTSDTEAVFTPAPGFTGAVLVTASPDADLDEGEERILPASGALEITTAEAQTAEIVFGTPVP
jgi:hypothetical protein